eukprot:TRINITY_DN57003_c0_g1_i1.p1 TRINITY_DN57003_c0_g1~~TRINITY_DN57003_c0_g1_i1.p1  ORF type:complete len:650 (-),score=71.36 TRINITY_DN57003_c0_g1_i1:37-1986(-)
MGIKCCREAPPGLLERDDLAGSSGIDETEAVVAREVRAGIDLESSLAPASAPLGECTAELAAAPRALDVAVAKATYAASEPDVSGPSIRQPFATNDSESMLTSCGSSLLGNLPRSGAAFAPRHLSESTLHRPQSRDADHVLIASGEVNPERVCHRCGEVDNDAVVDPSDLCRYCQECWIELYGEPPWSSSAGWPPFPEDNVLGPSPCNDNDVDKINDETEWTNISVCVRRGIVGDHARGQSQTEDLVGETLAGRYRVEEALGSGAFTQAYVVKDLKTNTQLCLKRYHRRCSLDELADLMVIGRRLKLVDPSSSSFPCMIDAFFDLTGFTTETLIQGPNCYAMLETNPEFFKDLEHMAHVARGVLHGLSLLEQAGIVHNDLKPDNILWLQSPADGDGSPRHLVGSSRAKGTSSVRIVDFGCARLDQRCCPGQNWNEAEGGAGHLGYASPEMTLGLPITHLNDIWSLGVLLCELHSGRGIWYTETLSSQEIMAQALGLSNSPDGIPPSLLRRATRDVTRYYTPMYSYSRWHLPVLRTADGFVEVLRPRFFGLVHVLGENWPSDKGALGELLHAILQLDFRNRPSARELLQRCSFVFAPADASRSRCFPSVNPLRWSGVGVRRPSRQKLDECRKKGGPTPSLSDMAVKKPLS